MSAPYYVRASRSLVCPYCGSGPGDRCTTYPSEKPTSNEHQERYEKIRVALDLGYEWGLEDAINLGTQDAKRQLAFMEQRNEAVS